MTLRLIAAGLVLLLFTIPAAQARLLIAGSFSSSQTIAGIAPSSCTVTYGVASNCAVTVTMSPASPTFATDNGTIALVASGGPCSGTVDPTRFSTTNSPYQIAYNGGTGAANFNTCLQASVSGITPAFQAVAITVNPVPVAPMSPLTYTALDNLGSNALLTTVNVPMSNASTFSGTCASTDATYTTVTAVSGGCRLNTRRAYTSADDGPHTFSLSATQNGVTLSGQTFTLTINPVSTPPTLTAHSVGVRCPGPPNTPTTCDGAPVAANTGDTLVVEYFVCNINCSNNTNAPLVGSISAAGGSINSCVEFPQSGGVRQDYQFSIDIWHCAVTSGGTITLTVTNSGAPDVGSFGFVYTQVIANATGDDGIGSIADIDFGSSLNVTASGPTTKAGDICISWAGGGGQTVTLGQTVLDYGQSDQGAQYQVVASAGQTPTATATSAANGSQIASVVCVKGS